jgi:nucleotide-binding universal stress UspA family protein
MHSSDTGIFADEAIALLKSEAETTLDQLTEMYGGNDVTRFTPEGTPTEDIIKTADSWNADLIVMGSMVGLDCFIYCWEALLNMYYVTRKFPYW